MLETLYGALHVPDWPDDLIVRSLRELGEWGAAEASLASVMLEPGETLWDAGAFIGTFALGVARLRTPSLVVAIEANPALSGILSDNLRTLRCPWAAVPAGLGPKQGWLVPAHEVQNNHGATSWRQIEDTDPPPSAVRCVTLPELRRVHGDYDVLKLDLEGMELDAMRSDFPYLKAHHPVLWTECNEEPTSLKLFSAMKRLGYQVLYLGFPACRRANFRASEDLIYPMAYEAALVAGPAERLARLAAQTEMLVPGEDILCRPVETVFDLRRALFDTPRWARAEWLSFSRAELIARLGRLEAKLPLKNFLRAGASD